MVASYSRTHIIKRRVRTTRWNHVAFARESLAALYEADVAPLLSQLYVVLPGSEKKTSLACPLESLV